MKPENDWLNSEITCLKYEKKKKRSKNTDTMLAIKLMLMITTVFFYAPLIEAGSYKIVRNKKPHANAGRNFVCHKCNTHQWQDSKNADWQGNFYCSVCENNLGK